MQKRIPSGGRYRQVSLYQTWHETHPPTWDPENFFITRNCNKLWNIYADQIIKAIKTDENRPRYAIWLRLCETQMWNVKWWYDEARLLIITVDNTKPIDSKERVIDFRAINEVVPTWGRYIDKTSQQLTIFSTFITMNNITSNYTLQNWYYLSKTSMFAKRTCKLESQKGDSSWKTINEHNQRW